MRFFLALLSLSFILACSPPEENAPHATSPEPVSSKSAGPDIRTVVLVTIDTWRRDATGFLGGREPSPTPFLDELAASGWIATDAISPVPLTGPSHWSMLTGRWPWRDGYRVNQDLPRRDEAVSLASVLQEAGWKTAAFVSAAPLDRRFGFANGFDHYDDKVSTQAGTGDGVIGAERRGDVTVNAALDWTQALAANERLFLWLHLFDPHFPYNAPGKPGNPGDVEAYLAEVAFADAQVRVLAEGLSAAGRPTADSLWAVLADHGEGLGEHGEISHGNLLHGATTRIPFFFAGPGVAAKRSERLAATVDVAPTLLAHLGLAMPPNDGTDLLNGDGAGNLEQRSVPLESLAALRDYGLSPVFGLRTKEWLWERSPENHLWDLAVDPMETNNIAAEKPEVLAALGRERRSFGMPSPEPAAVVDDEARRQLAALGYLSSGLTTGEGDVREFMNGGEQMYKDLLERQHRGDLEGAEDLAQRFVKAYPNATIGWLAAGFVAVARQDAAAAEQRFQRAAELDPVNVQAWVNLGNVYFLTNRPDAAATAYSQALALDDDEPSALFGLGAVASLAGRPEEAAGPWQKLIELHPDHPQAPAVKLQLEAWRNSN